MSSGTFKAKIKPMNGGIQIRPTPTVKAVSDPITYICCYKIVLMFYNGLQLTEVAACKNF